MNRYIVCVILSLLVSSNIVALSPVINLDAYIGDAVYGKMTGTFDMGFGVFTSKSNAVEFETCGTKTGGEFATACVWFERYSQIQIVDGRLVHTLGASVDNRITPDVFKQSPLYIGLFFMTGDKDHIFLPLNSHPKSIVSQHANITQSLTNTEAFFGIDTKNKRIGIGVTQNLHHRLTIDGEAMVGVMHANTVKSEHGEEIHNIDYNHLIHVDSHSLDSDNGMPDIVYVSANGRVGIGRYLDDRMAVSGDVNVTGGLYGHGSLVASGNQSLSGIFGGYSHQSYAIGTGNTITKDCGFGVGVSHNIVLDEGVAFGGQHRISGKVDDASSGGYAGKNHSIYGALSAIGGGQSSAITGNSSVIIGGAMHAISSNRSVIFGGSNNQVTSENSLLLGKNSAVSHSSVFLWSDASGFDSGMNKQFLLHATNGVEIGGNQSTGQSVSGHTIQQNSLRVLGDIVSGGYFIGNGQYLTQLNALWLAGALNDLVYLTDQFVSIGPCEPGDACTVNTDAAMTIQGNDHRISELHVIHSNATLNIGVSDTTGTSTVNASSMLKLQTGGSIGATQLSISDTVTTVYGNVTGNVAIDGGNAEFMSTTVHAQVVASGIATSEIRASTFVGNGSQLNNLGVSMLVVPTSGYSNKPIGVDMQGRIGIGTNSPISAVHIVTMNNHIQLSNDSKTSTLHMNNQTLYIDSLNSVPRLVNFALNTADSTVFQLDSNGQSFISGNAYSTNTVSANAFVGSGANLTNIQLDTKQQQSVTFAQGLSIPSGGVLRLTPLESVTCNDDGSPPKLVVKSTNDGGKLSLELCQTGALVTIIPVESMP